MNGNMKCSSLYTNIHKSYLRDPATMHYGRRLGTGDGSIKMNTKEANWPRKARQPSSPGIPVMSEACVRKDPGPANRRVWWYLNVL